ncbi:MAG: Gfo/Idh/MocA family oxidoreductase [Acidobacteriaceae bacterium]
MINFGIVGFGLHAVKRLMPGFSLATNCKVVALSRRDLGKAQASAKQFGIPLAFDSAEALCRAPEVDAVLVTTPNAMHLQDVLTAVRCGKPVLCEKPMGMNAAECEQMVKAARQANLLLGVAQVFRFEASTARLRDRIAAGQIGKPIFARAEFSFTAAENHPRTWINDPTVAGGGPIADVGVHAIDALRFILQDEVVRVGAQAVLDERFGGMESAAVISLEFSRGTLGTVLVSFRAEYRTPLEFVGETGVLFANNGLTVDRPIELQLFRDGNLVEKESIFNRLAYARQVDAFATAIMHKIEFPVPGEEGVKNQQILDAAYLSITTGRTENIA